MYYILSFLLFFFVTAYSQEDNEIREVIIDREKTKPIKSDVEKQVIKSADSATVKVRDSLYREDQFYIGITYNILRNRPQKLSQNSFSTGIHFGFLRDMPINKKRDLAIALGFGYSINNLRQNLEGISFSNDSSLNATRTNLVLHYIELPLEFRFRTSTIESHKFWRVYGGFKAGYLVYDTYRINGTRLKISKDIMNDIQYGVYLAFGYNTFNFYGYSGLNSLFKGASADIVSINLGFMFYIL